MGCSESRPEPEPVVVNVEYRNVPATQSDYPPPYHPETNKREIYDEEVNKYIQNRIDEMPIGTDATYTSLLKYLTSGQTKEVQHVTAIYLWMKSQDYSSPDLDVVKDGDTPSGYKKMIKEDSGDITSFFTILCRHSGIQCIILSGLGKNEEYFIGASEHTMSTRWTAVFADEEWHFVHIEWALQSGNDDNQNDTDTQASDFFFFPDPDEFSTICSPDNYQWQLVNQPLSKKQFLGLPNYRPQYFAMSANILAPKSGTARAVNGKIDIELSFPKRHINTVQSSFCMRYLEESNENESGNTAINNLNNYVFVNRKSSKFIYEICLPKPGRYMLDIYGGYGNKSQKRDKQTLNKQCNGLERLCQFRIISDKQFEEDEIEPLPENSQTGWGPGPSCRHLGLVPLTHFEGCIYMKPGEVCDVLFKMEHVLDVTCQLTHNFLPIYDLVEQVECEKNDDEVQIRVQIPEDGQYALKIYCRDSGSKEFHEACVYLIRQRQGVSTILPEKYRDKKLRIRLEDSIKNHTSEKSLIDAIEVFKCYNVPDHGEVKQGEEKLKQYWEIKRELRSAIKGRNGNVVHKWIDKAKHSKYRADLDDDIQEAERLEGNLTRRKGMHPIARMDPHTMTEIRNYKRPPVIVHDVMKSTYLLLGERRDDVEEWEQIQYLMGRQGKESLQKRVICRRPEDVHIEVVDEVDNIIQPYSMGKCRAVSNGICSFYKWDKQLIKDARQNEEERERKYMLQKDEDESERKEAERLQIVNDAGDAEEHSISPSPTDREQVEFKGRGEPHAVEEEDNHPFGIIENDDIDKKPRQFLMNPSKPSEGKQSSPVSYAGWKPSEL